MPAAFLAGLFAAAVAVLTTVAIERFGGRLGGLLGTMPTTIVPASAGMAAAAPNDGELVVALCSVPGGMLLSALFLWSWRVVPPRIAGATLPSRLFRIVVCTLVLWLVGAALMVSVLDTVVTTAQSAAMAGVVGIVAIIAVGAWACRGASPAPKGHRKVSLMTLLGRGVLAGAAIGISVLIARLGHPVAAGIASVFPAIFLTTMVALWWSQGESVQVGAVGPMMLGSSAVASYALFAALVMPALGWGLGALISWIAAVATTTVPAWWWLNRRATSA